MDAAEQWEPDEARVSRPVLRNFYKVELWTRDEQRVLRMLYAGSNLDKARTIFASYIRIRPRARVTIRQRTRVLDQWPRRTP